MTRRQPQVDWGSIKIQCRMCRGLARLSDTVDELCPACYRLFNSYRKDHEK